MNRKIVSIVHSGSDYFYRELSLEDIAKEFDADSSEVDEVTLIGMLYDGVIVIGLEEDFFHSHLSVIYEEIVNGRIKPENALYFTLFYAKDYKNAGGRDSFQAQGGLLLPQFGWGVWPFSSENAKYYEHGLLPEDKGDEILDAFSVSPKVIYLER